MSKHILGLDIGIASVGWGIIDDKTGTVVDCGVRLFSEGAAENNAERRRFRSARRLLRRRSFRLEQMRKFLKGIDLIDDNFIIDTSSDPYLIRAKGLTEKLSKKELATAILHITKRRGIDNIDVIEDDDALQKEQGETTAAVNENDKLLKKYGFICKLQLYRLSNGDKKIRGTENRFRTSQYVSELKEILKHQNISSNNQEKIIGLISYRRAYYDGPGSEKSPTEYGQYFVSEDGVLQHINMIDKMRGKCSVYPEEFRAPKASYTACLFNLLNDLNNLEYQGKKIAPEQKKEIISKYVDEKGGISPKQLAKYLGVELDEIKGFRINKNDEPILTGFGGYQKGQKNFTKQPTGYGKLLKLANDGKIPAAVVANKEYVDKIIDVLAAHKDVSKRSELIKKINEKIFTNSAADILSKISGVTGYHSLSYKAMRMMMDDLLNTSDNQMQILAQSGIHSENRKLLKGLTNIPFSDESIYSPVAKRAQREAVKIVNAVRKQYGEMDVIVIEMARDKNSEEQRKRIRDEQKRNEKTKIDIMDLTNGKVNYKSKTATKIRLYQEQNGKCLYTGKSIDLEHLIKDPQAYEIDHIIPLSISFDDSLQNKTLCYMDANQRKGQRTPFAYFASGDTNGRSYEHFKGDVLSLKNISQKKREYLLFEKDITRYDTQKEFIARNLVDTQYASRVILGTLKDYFKANQISTAVHTVRGAVTATFRKKARIEKDRDEDYRHHAVDALIVAGIKRLNLMEKVFHIAIQESEGETIAYDRATGEIITPISEKEYFDEKFLKFVSHLRDTVKDTVRYSHKIDRKPNRSISDQTIYGIQKIDGAEYTIKKYSDIYNDATGEKVAKDFRSGKAKDKFLMARHDPITFSLLEKIVNEYPSVKNPFSAYRAEHEYIRKCGKSNGPIIKSLRYDGGKFVTGMDISHKYQDGKGGKVVKLSLTPYRIDVYKNHEGHYLFLRVTYNMLRKQDNGYAILMNMYEKEKDARKIENDATFQFSLYKNDIFGYKEKGKIEEIVRFNGVYAYNSNRVEYKPINCSVNDRLSLSIGRKTELIKKYSTDILGHRYRVQNEICTFTLLVLH